MSRIVQRVHVGQLVGSWVVSGEVLPAPAGPVWPSPRAYRLWLAHGGGLDPAEFVQLPKVAELVVHPRRGSSW